MPVWFDVDGNDGGHVAIYTGNDDAPMANPTAYIGTRTRFSTRFNYIPFVPAKTIGPRTINIPTTVTVSPRWPISRSIDLGPHGMPGVPFIYGFVTVGSQVRPLCGTVPVKVASSSGSVIHFTLIVTTTNVIIVEGRDYPSISADPVSVVVYISDKTVI